MEWTSTAIQIWFFPRNAIPDSIASGAPDTSTFGTPAANFQGNCDIDTYFYNHSLIINTDFCGQYAGNVWTPYVYRLSNPVPEIKTLLLMLVAGFVGLT